MQIQKLSLFFDRQYRHGYGGVVSRARRLPIPPWLSNRYIHGPRFASELMIDLSADAATAL